MSADRALVKLIRVGLSSFDVCLLSMIPVNVLGVPEMILCMTFTIVLFLTFMLLVSRT